MAEFYVCCSIPCLSQFTNCKHQFFLYNTSELLHSQTESTKRWFDSSTQHSTSFSGVVVDSKDTPTHVNNNTLSLELIWSYRPNIPSEQRFSSHVTLVSHTNKVPANCADTPPPQLVITIISCTSTAAKATHAITVYSLAAELSELPTDGSKLTRFFFREIFPIWSWNWVRDRRSNTEPIPTQWGVFYRGSSYLEPIVSNSGTEQSHTKWNLPWDISLKEWKLLPDEEHDSSL